MTQTTGRTFWVAPGRGELKNCRDNSKRPNGGFLPIFIHAQVRNLRDSRTIEQKTDGPGNTPPVLGSVLHLLLVLRCEHFRCLGRLVVGGDGISGPVIFSRQKSALRHLLVYLSLLEAR